MRLTNNILLRGYNRDLSRLRNAKNDCEKKITSTRKFSRASDDPLAAAKALNVRKSQYYSEQHKENLKVASSFYTEAETSLLQVSTKMAEIRETIIAAVNTTKDIMDYNIYAQQLETSARELCSIFNTDSAGRSIFGGESDDPMPFQIIDDSNGNASTVLYHGVPVNSLREYTGFPYSDKVYVDIGLGMQTDQESHVTDPMSVLDISFNGAEVTGCGAESSVADIDLSAVKFGRKYVFDIYCDGTKKTIELSNTETANAKDREGFVKLVNDKFKEAFKKDVAYGKNSPVMDESGVVYSVDVDGKVVEGGLVSITNNTYGKNADRTEPLVIDNDSGYTDKFRLNAANLTEGLKYSLVVKVGDESKTIEFEAGTDNLSDTDNPVYREEITIKNVQAALDKAFGEGVVTISDHEPTMGIISSEGKRVSLATGKTTEEVSGESTKTSSELTITASNSVSKLNLSAMRVSKNEQAPTKFTFMAGANTIEVEIEPGASEKDIMDAVNAKLGEKGLSVDANGIVKNAGGDVQTIRATGDNAKVAGSFTQYKIDPAALEDGKTYNIKVIFGNDLKNIEFTAGDGDIGDLQTKLDEAFGANKVVVSADGTFSNPDYKAVSVSVDGGDSTQTNKLFERERIYSNNYIQLTLDAARALRNGDIEYANGCIDRIVSANEHLLVEIADLGCNEDFIDFNIERITTREYNLAERQNDLETADAEYQITLWKQFEAYYNACLQMSSTVIPNSIFNYMK